MNIKTELFEALRNSNLHHIEQQVSLLWGTPGYEPYVKALLLDVDRKQFDGTYGFRRGFPHELVNLFLISINDERVLLRQEHPDGTFTFKYKGNHG